MLERVGHPVVLMRRRVACDSRVSVASDCESACADGAGVFKRRKQVVGFGEVLAHGSGALVGRGVPGGVGRGCRRGKRTDLGAKHILTTRHENFLVGLQLLSGVAPLDHVVPGRRSERR